MIPPSSPSLPSSDSQLEWYCFLLGATGNSRGAFLHSNMRVAMNIYLTGARDTTHLAMCDIVLHSM